MTAFFLGMCLTETGALAESLYSFVDSKGVVHFSNAPTDPRYKKMKVPKRPLLRLTPVSAKAVQLAILRHSNNTEWTQPSFVPSSELNRPSTPTQFLEKAPWD